MTLVLRIAQTTNGRVFHFALIRTAGYLHLQRDQGIHWPAQRCSRVSERTCDLLLNFLHRLIQPSLHDVRFGKGQFPNGVTGEGPSLPGDRDYSNSNSLAAGRVQYRCLACEPGMARLEGAVAGSDESVPGEWIPGTPNLSAYCPTRANVPGSAAALASHFFCAVCRPLSTWVRCNVKIVSTYGMICTGPSIPLISIVGKI